MPSSNYAEQWILGPLETSFYTRLYMPKDVPIRAAMVFVHGYLEHIGRYETFHSAWAARGVAVFAYDERGFGRTALDEKKSAKSVYGQTGGAVERMLDVQWAIKYTRGKVERVPLFLMGHSMGGGQVLSFATRTESPPDKETVAMLSGVIASSPLVHITKPPPSALVRLLTMVGKVFPNTVLSTPVQDKELSHDPTIGEDSLKDPWIKGIGTIRGLTDMLNRVR
ncbi:Alpha/Beta hydrolase protein, partial [Amylostereum chailletii]